MKKQMRYIVTIVIGCMLAFSCYANTVNSTAETKQVPQKNEAIASSAKLININTADAKTISDADLKGIGKKRAEAIIAYRQAHGPFKNIDDLSNIKGISQKVIDANRSKLSLN